VTDEVLAEPGTAQEFAVGGDVVAGAQERGGTAVEPLDLQHHPDEVDVLEPGRLREDAGQSAPARVLQAALVAADAHAHLGGPHRDVQFGEQLAQPRIGRVVVDDEPAVDGDRAVAIGHVVRVGVAAEPVVGLEQGHVVGPGEQVRRREAGDAGADDRHGRPAGRLPLRGRHGDGPSRCI
jgi:hypothetical protein